MRLFAFSWNLKALAYDSKQKENKSNINQELSEFKECFSLIVVPLLLPSTPEMHHKRK